MYTWLNSSFCLTVPYIFQPLKTSFARPKSNRDRLAVGDGGGEVSSTDVALLDGGASLLGDDILGGDGVAVGDVAAGVEGVSDLEAVVAVVLLLDGPGVGHVVGALAVLDGGESAIGTLDHGRASVLGQRRVALNLEGVAAQGRLVTVFA